MNSVDSSRFRAWIPYLVMGIGLMAVSTAPIFIRLAQEAEAPSLTVSALRLVVASLVLTPVVLSRHRSELRQLERGDLVWAGLSGLVLGLHFSTWISSLEYTSVVNSVVIVSTSPLWVALVAPFFLKETVGRWTMIGLVLALLGGMLVSVSGESGDPPTRQDPALGNTLSLIGAVMSAIYFMIGRRMRARLSVMVYIWLVYNVAAVVLLFAVAALGEQLGGLSWQAYLWIAMIGLVPQLIGHSSFNYALGYLPAAYVSLILLGEPVGSGLLAIIFLQEWPVLLQLVGALFVLAGIALSSQEQDVESKEVLVVEGS